MMRRFVLLLASALAPIAAAPSLRAQESQRPTESASPAHPDPVLASAAESETSGDHDETPEPEPALTPPDPAERKALEDRLQALDGAGLSADDKQHAVEFYQQALQSFDAATQQLEAAAKFAAELERTKTGKQSTEATAAKLAAALPPYEDVTGESLADIEKRAEVAETALAGYREELAAMIAEPKRRSQRITELPKQIDDAQQKLQQATDALAALGGEDSADVVASAHRSALMMSLIELKATLHAFANEQQLYEQSGDWMAVRRDYFARYVPHKEKRLAQLREIINQLRASEAAERARLAAAAAEVERPRAVRELADANKQLADDGADVTGRMTDVTGRLDAVRTETTRLTKQFNRAQEQAGELSSLGGQLLRDQQAKLPDARAMRRNSAQRESELSDVLLRLYDLNDQRAELANIDDLAAEIAASTAESRAVPLADVLQLLQTKRDSLDQLIDDYDKFSKSLNELHSEEAKLVELTEAYSAYIAERVLWIHSCAAPLASDWQHLVRGATWSLDPRHWHKAGVAMIGTCSNQPAWCVAFLTGLIALAVVHAPARRRLNELGEEVRRRDCTRLRPTLQAVGVTAVVALPWPALLAFLGWSIDSLNYSEFVSSLGYATRTTALCLLVLELARTLCRRGGLADAHFNWPAACLAQVRGKLHWLALLGAPLTLWIIGLEMQGIEPRWSSSLGRALFVAVMVLLGAIFQRLLLASASPFRQLVLISHGGWLAPVQIVWRPAVVALPIALALLATVGYYYTAQQAALRILQTVAMLLAVLVLGGVTRRWLLVSHRRLAREQARQRRAQLVATTDDDPASSTAADLCDEAVDLAALSEKTQKLVHTFLAVTTTVGLVLIWGAILPALQYPAKHLLPGAAVLTWGDLVAFLLILAVTYITVRDVPALLELVVLQHLPLDSGSRYAATSVSRYLLSAMGLVAAFKSVGGEWTQIQWLVAAMSVGLGFGLQEIFANFVSGIILLFERPIRVGDIVTLGDKSGVVNRIRMRATTIVDWDRKEYIVPNKDLVTERLLNWTLSDHTNRIEIVLNVANGSDTDLACRLMLEAAREQPYILQEPSPAAMFEGFGDNGLRLALRCFLPNLENRGATIHGLHTAIDRKFHAAGIDGAYGDLRIRVAREAARGMQAPPHEAFAADRDALKRRADAGRHDAA
jgi:potassium efflux system protein